MRTAPFIVALAISALAQTQGQRAATLEEQAERLFDHHQWSEAASAAEAAVRADPGRVNAHVILGLIATREGKQVDATRHFEKASALRPGDARITAYLASAYFQQGRAREAEPLFRRVVAADPGNQAAHFNLGLLLLQRGAARDAEAQFQFVAKADASDIAAAAGILECRLMEGNRTAASESAGKIHARLQASDPERLRIAALLARYGRWDLVPELLQPVPAGLRHSLEARYDLALAYSKAGEPEKAAKVLLDSAALLQQADAQRLLGNIEENLGQLPAAREALNRAAALAPGSEDVAFDRAVFELEHGSATAAVSTFRAGIDTFPRSWRMRLGLADAQYLAGNPADAVETLLDLVHQTPGLTPAYTLLASLYEQAPAQQERIYEEFNAYVNRGSADAQTYTAFAKVLNVRANAGRKRDDRTILFLQRALALDPKLTEAYLELAAVESDRGEIEKSRELLAKAVRLAPDAPEPHYRLARVYQKLGRKEQAATESATFRRLRQNAGGAEAALAVSLKQEAGRAPAAGDAPAPQRVSGRQP